MLSLIERDDKGVTAKSIEYFLADR